MLAQEPETTFPDPKFPERDLPSVESPSGKDAGYENFPVGSWLLPRHLRSHILTFYDFARAIDDIADSPTLTSDEKLRRLGEFENVLQSGEPLPGYEKAACLNTSLMQTKVTNRHARDLVWAFRQDSVTNRCENWDDLMAYCSLSAAPVGRYLLDLHGVGEEKELYRYSDALCCALQVINHVQDCVDDFVSLDRVYLPLDWIREEDADVTMLRESACTVSLRRVLDRALDGTEDLLRKSAPLAGQLRLDNSHRRADVHRLAFETAVIQRIATVLSKRLRTKDPVAKRVSLGKIAYVFCGVLGVADMWFSRGKKG